MICVTDFRYAKLGQVLVLLRFHGVSQLDVRFCYDYVRWEQLMTLILELALLSVNVNERYKLIKVKLLSWVEWVSFPLHCYGMRLVY